LPPVFGRNVHDQGAVVVTSSGNAKEKTPKNVADLAATSTYFSSMSCHGVWICYDFMTRRVFPTHYSLRSAHEFASPRSWVLEGSSDSVSWIELDRREDDHRLKYSNNLATFSVTHPEKVRMIRLRITRINCKGGNDLAVSAWEVFGSLFSSRNGVEQPPAAPPGSTEAMGERRVVGIEFTVRGNVPGAAEEDAVGDEGGNGGESPDEMDEDMQNRAQKD
jgi:hypothetical protein